MQHVALESNTRKVTKIKEFTKNDFVLYLLLNVLAKFYRKQLMLVHTLLIHWKRRDYLKNKGILSYKHVTFPEGCASHRNNRTPSVHSMQTGVLRERDLVLVMLKAYTFSTHGQQWTKQKESNATQNRN